MSVQQSNLYCNDGGSFCIEDSTHHYPGDANFFPFHPVPSMRHLARRVLPLPVQLPDQVQPNAPPAIQAARVSVNERLRISPPNDGVVLAAGNSQPGPSTSAGANQQNTITVTPSDLSTIISSVVDKISDTAERNLRHVLSSTVNLMGLVDDRPYERRVFPASGA